MRFTFPLIFILLFAAPSRAEPLPWAEEGGKRNFIALQLNALEQAIARYRMLAEIDSQPPFPAGETIRPGGRDPRLIDLRETLARLGDYAVPEEHEMADPTVYDATLVDAVKRFQARHALEPDGAIGKGTAQALSVPASERVRQLELNASRLREFLTATPVDMDARAVVVNVPGFTLYTFEHGKATHAMRAIVGRPDRPTPLLTSRIVAVHFNPSWTVPSTIATKDLLPKIRKDPEFLAKGGYMVLRHGEEIDPATIDWAHTDGRGFTLRQRPGDDNALGKVKFTIPNSDAIFLHSTSQPKLFAKASRALSSGCIRIGDPRAFTQFVLLPNTLPNNEAIDAYYNDTEPKTLGVRPSIPVYFIYLTALADMETGEVNFYPDIYGKDKENISPPASGGI